MKKFVLIFLTLLLMIFSFGCGEKEPEDIMDELFIELGKDDTQIAHVPIELTATETDIIKLRSDESNAKLMKDLFNWSDVYDYSIFELIEEYDLDGNLIKREYFDANENNIGWNIYVEGERITYVYILSFENGYTTNINQDYIIIIERTGSLDNTMTGTSGSNAVTRIFVENTFVKYSIEILFDQDGAVSSITQSLEGESHGLNMYGNINYANFDYYENGQLKAESEYTNQILTLLYLYSEKDGKTYNEQKYYFDDGSLMLYQTVVDGKIDGDSKIYYANGQVKEEGAFENDNFVGVWTYYNEDGSLYKTVTFEAGGGVLTEYANGETHYTEP